MPRLITFEEYKLLFIEKNGEKDMFGEPFSEAVIRFHATVNGYKLRS